MTAISRGAPMKNSIPVTRLAPKPSRPHGSNRCTSVNGTRFITPRMRRLTASSTPNVRERPRKWMVSDAGQAHGLFTMITLIFDATNRSGSPAGSEAAEAPARISG